jgi:hypothetical protein
VLDALAGPILQPKAPTRPPSGDRS